MELTPSLKAPLCLILTEFPSSAHAFAHVYKSPSLQCQKVRVGRATICEIGCFITFYPVNSSNITNTNMIQMLLTVRVWKRVKVWHILLILLILVNAK